jgi:hypothetical protein
MQGLFYTLHLNKYFLMTIRAIIFLGILLIGCKNNKTKIEVDANWIKHHLPNSWTIYTPSKFKISKLQKVNSEAGFISSLEDSILLNYDTGNYLLLKESDSSFTRIYEKAKLTILNEKENKSNFQIDTIDKKIILIKTSKTKGIGETKITIIDCKNGAIIEIYGENFNLEREKQIVKNFQTIELDR